MEIALLKHFQIIHCCRIVGKVLNIRENILSLILTFEFLNSLFVTFEVRLYSLFYIYTVIYEKVFRDVERISQNAIFIYRQVLAVFPSG